MNNKFYRVLCFVVVVYCIKREALADKEDKSEEVTDYQEVKQRSEGNSSSEVLGPPDSHEAMNTREIDSKILQNNREKRSYEFLMGLINNNSKYEVTNVDLPSPTLEHPKTQSAANEVLLELLVRIAADPDQWEKVHALLQRIDTDLKTSRKLLNTFKNSLSNSDSIKPLVKIPDVTYTKKGYIHTNEIEQKSFDNNNEISSETETTGKNTSSHAQIHKMTVLLNDAREARKQLRNETEMALKTNQWPRFEETEGHLVYGPPDNEGGLKYPWKNKLSGKPYPRNFAYHRVTGHPFYRPNYNKNPKAYIAVSVIAPKPLKTQSEDNDLILENELRQLKPWTHKQNLGNMAAIRSQWIIQSDSNKNNSTP